MTIARAIGLANGSERSIQRNMAQHGVGTYMAQQKKFISTGSIEKRGIWGLLWLLGRNSFCYETLRRSCQASRPKQSSAKIT